MTPVELKKIEMEKSESSIQHTCVHWWRLTFPGLSKLLWAVPNGGNRDAKTGKQMNREGAQKGVPDLSLMIPKGGKGGLFIEMKRPPKEWTDMETGKAHRKIQGKPSTEQKEYEALLTKYGYAHAYCYGLLQFIEIVGNYFNVPIEQIQAWQKEALRKYLYYEADFKED